MRGRRHHRWRPRGAHPRFPWRLRQRVFRSLVGALLFGGLVAWLLDRWFGGVGLWPAVGAVLLIAWWASAVLAYRLVGPMAALADMAEAIGQGRLDVRVEPRRARDEAGALARAMNDMAARLEAQAEAERTLLASVSHELRTPLGHLRVLTELAEARGLDPALAGEFAAELAELDALVGELLARSRVEQIERRPRALPPVDLLELVERALDRAQVPADALSAEPSAVTVLGDATLLLRALANLLDNAQKHGGGVARVRVREEAGEVEVAIEDRGPPAEAAAREDTRGGLGLGLALVERIARVHGGRSSFIAGPEGGRATLRLPLVADT